jgi:copper resistance protein C
MHRLLLALILFVLPLPQAQAHTGVRATLPADGSTLSSPPESIAIEFGGPLRLTLFRLSGPEGEVELKQRPSAATSERFESAPSEALPAGRYRVEWRALAADGHLMSGEFGFTVEP